MNKNLNANKLIVKSFRGINHEISIDLYNITILLGENGMGKSSFVNAIEYLFSEKLDFLRKNTINREKSTVNLNSTIDDVKIQLNFKKNRYIKFENGKLSNSEFFDDILKNTYVTNASFILNRKKLLSFIDGTQGSRYDSITDLCGLDYINKIQKEFSSAKTTLNKNLNNLNVEYETKLKELSSILVNKDNLNFDECIINLNKLLESNGYNTISKNTNIMKYKDNLGFSKKNIFLDKISDFKKIYDKVDFDINLSEILTQYEKIASDNLKSSQALLDTLNSSKKYINLTKTDTCPVCDSEIDSDEILLKISDKIDNLNKTNTEYKNWKNDVQKIINHLDTQITYCENLSELIDDLKIIDDLFNFDYEILISLKDDLNEFIDFKKFSQDFDYVDFTQLLSEVEEIKNILSEYESENKDDDASKIYECLLIIQELKDKYEEINSLENQFEIANKTFNIFNETKEKFIDDIIREIRDYVKEFYNFIHASDKINSPDIKLSSSKKIDVYLNSFGNNVDSRSFASEGHLDTLGICIFLAFNKKFNPLPLIIFDDILTTVDFPHKERIGRLIVEKFSDNQFIITTHNSLWADQLKRICIDVKKYYRIYKLIDWTLKEGPIFSKPLDSEEKIQKYLSNDYQDFEAAGNTARRYLEYTLLEICKINNIKIPIKEKYDVGTLFNDVNNYILKSVNGTSLESYYTDVWSEINQTKYLANLLSHNNEESPQLPKRDVEKFCIDVINLKKAHTCDCGRGILEIDSKSKKLICTSNKCRDSVDMNGFN